MRATTKAVRVGRSGGVTEPIPVHNCTNQYYHTAKQCDEIPNKHDLEKLMEQHKIDIDSLGKQHQQELEKMELEHKHKLELIAKESENNLSQNLMTGLVGEIMKMPEAKAEIAKGIRQSSNKKGGKR